MFRLIFGKHPRRGFVNVFIRSSKKREHDVDRVGNAEFVHKSADFSVSGNGDIFKFFVNGFGHAGSFHQATEVFFAHRDRSLDEVAVYVGEIAVDFIGHKLPADKSVVIERHIV